MSKQVEFGEIDFEAIEYRNEYRHTKAVFACLTAQALSLSTFLKWLFEDDVRLALFGGACLGLFAFTLATLFIQYRSRVTITGQSVILNRSTVRHSRKCPGAQGDAR